MSSLKKCHYFVKAHNLGLTLEYDAGANCWTIILPDAAPVSLKTDNDMIKFLDAY